MGSIVYLKKNKKVEYGVSPSSYQIYGKKGKIFNNHIQHFMSKNISELLKDSTETLRFMPRN